jgi:gas vesicle protein
MRRHYEDEFDDEDEGPYVVIEKRSGGVGSFFLGLAVGAGLALLLAPQSGEATRRGLTRRARRVKEAAEDAVADASASVHDTFAAARQRVEEKLGEAREAIETKREQVQRAVEAGRAAAEQARADLERRLAETKAAYNAGAQVARDARAARAVEPAAEAAAAPKERRPV